MTSTCGKYALISLCFIKLPTCRQPDLLNSQYFGQLAKIIHHNYRLKYFGHGRSNMSWAAEEHDFQQLMDKSNFNLLCREDCRALENEVCEKEFAIGKRHPIIGQFFLNFNSCNDLLGVSGAGTVAQDDEAVARPEVAENPNCLAIGVNQAPDVKAVSTEKCFWKDGSAYRGEQKTTISGRRCEYWTKNIFKEIHLYPELIGINYCR